MPARCSKMCVMTRGLPALERGVLSYFGCVCSAGSTIADGLHDHPRGVSTGNSRYKERSSGRCRDQSLALSGRAYKLSPRSPDKEGVLSGRPRRRARRALLRRSSRQQRRATAHEEPRPPRSRQRVESFRMPHQALRGCARSFVSRKGVERPDRGSSRRRLWSWPYVSFAFGHLSNSRTPECLHPVSVGHTVRLTGCGPPAQTIDSMASRRPSPNPVSEIAMIANAYTARRMIASGLLTLRRPTMKIHARVATMTMATMP